MSAPCVCEESGVPSGHHMAVSRTGYGDVTGSKFIFLTSVTVAAQPAGLPRACGGRRSEIERKHAAIEKRTHARRRTHTGWGFFFFFWDVHKQESTQTHTQTLTRTGTGTPPPDAQTHTHTHAVSEKGKGFVTVTLHSEKMRRLTE